MNGEPRQSQTESAVDLADFMTGSAHLIGIYFAFKLLVVLTLIFGVPLVFDRSYFLYVDFDGYVGCDHRSLNSFFSSLVCILNIDSIKAPSAVVASSTMNTLRDLGYIWIATRYLNKHAAIIFTFLLATHPYLGLYHAKLATSNFAAFGVFIFILGHTFKTRPWYFDAIQILLTGFRNGLAALYIIDYAVTAFQKISRSRKPKTSSRPKIQFNGLLRPLICIFFIIVTINIPSHSYFGAVSDSLVHYELNPTFWVEALGLPTNLFSAILGYVLLAITNLILLTGFREAAFTTFPEYFQSQSITTLFSIISGLFLVVFHCCGLFFFARWCKEHAPRILLVFALVLPSLLFVAHMRYLLPLMPLAIFGICYLLDTSFFNRCRILKNDSQKYRR